jgi:heterodisulfide reductase subunit A
LEIHIFYVDMRTSFKGYEEFYRRAREMGITFIRGKPAELSEDPTTGNLVVYSENQMTGKAMTLEADLVVLAQAAVPRAGTDKLTRTLNIMRDSSGFLLEAHPKLKPIDTSTSGIFICGSAQGPKDIPFSVAQGSAAAARAARILSKDKWMIEPIVASVSRDLCIRVRDPKAECGICITRCAFQAISAEKGQAAIINPAKCQGCGTCVAECPHNAITQMHFTDEQILSQIRELLRHEPEKKILAFLCNWCSYAGADLAGTSRFEYPPNVRTVRVMCSGRVDRDFIMSAFTMGAGMVLVSGCRLTEMGNDCHYISGNVWAKKRVETLRRALEATGISGERLRLEWISAAEGQKFADLIRDMNEKLKALGSNKVREENEKAKPNLERMLKHSTPPQQTITAKIE